MIVKIEIKNLDELEELTQKAVKLSNELEQVIQEINDFKIELNELET